MNKKNIYKLFYKVSITLNLFIIVISLYNCSSSKNISGIKIYPRSEWNAIEPKPFPTHNPVRITIHHEGTYFDPKKEDAKTHIRNTQIWGMSEARNWVDIPYHFLIDFDGKIYEGRNVFTKGETATEYNPDGHLLITCLGNFEEQKISKKQLESLINITAYCCAKYNIPPDSIRTHKDYANTLCPGKDLYKYFENGSFIKKVKKKLNNSTF
ncbi:MAG: hypothetical protein STSR0008_10450 [Ignavibacterium sp.]